MLRRLGARTGFSICLWATLCSLTSEVAAAQLLPPQDLSTVELNDEERARLATEFAPALVFHQAEEYFPLSPLFSIEMSTPDTGLPVSYARPQISLLGTPESRIRSYRALTLRQKAELATVYYRAYPSRMSGEPVVVLEYWLYYVRNEYRIRATPLPFSFNVNHPNDLEHIHVILRSLAGDTFVVDSVYASAHEGTMPANRYRYPQADHQGGTRFSVELGSHAMAPDIDENGRFTPGPDGHSGEKMVWGIRDEGRLGILYQPSYMDERFVDRAPVLVHSPGGATLGDTGAEFALERLTYRLVPVESLEADFASLSLTESEREEAFEVDMFWVKRLFGGDNGSSETLLIPPRAQIGGESVGIDRWSSSETGILVGTSFGVEEHGLFLGWRYSLLHSKWYLPDPVLELNGSVTERNQYLSSQFLLSYPIHGLTRMFGGRELIIDSITFARRQWNWMGGFELRLGHMRIQAGGHSGGDVSPLTQELRVAYLF